MSDPAAYHEFGMFGESRVYLSHYPMYHSIHAYQVILETKLLKGGRDWSPALRRDQKAHADRSYTLSPSRKGSPVTRRRADWSLPSYMKKGRAFNADVHWGGDVNQFLGRDVTTKITSVVHFRRFREDDPRSPELRYIIFGQPGDLYLAHLISARPDFDQIVSVELVDGALPDGPYLELRVPRPDVPDSRLRGTHEVIEGTVVATAGPGPTTARQYPSPRSGRASARARSNRVKVRVLGEKYYTMLDEQG